MLQHRFFSIFLCLINFSHMRVKQFLLILSVLVVFIACRKDNLPEDDTTEPPTTEETLLLTADSVYLYSKEIYLWNTALPDFNTFNPRQYKRSTELETANSVMTAIRNFNDHDKEKGYSYVTTHEQAGLSKSGEDIDYGFFVKDGYNYNQFGQRSFKGWFVSYCYPESDAGKAGVKRGWKINKINGTLLTTQNVNIINNVFVHQSTKADSTTTFEFIKPDQEGGGTQTNTFTIKKFTANPVLYSNVFTSASGKTVGYLVFNKFFGQSARDEIGRVFTEFQNKNINELILDLRYNGGGITATQDTLANLIAPAAANGSVMYTYEYNSQLQSNDFPLLKRKFGWSNNFFTKENNTERFNIKNNLNLTRVFVIVSHATASASELLINNLKGIRPLLNVQLIGDENDAGRYKSSNTYGKPVGFFGIDLFKKVTFYPVSFRTINQKSEADFYSGFPPDFVMYDGVDKNWGDQTEDCFFAALFYINNNRYPLTSTTTLPRSVSSFPKLDIDLKIEKTPGMIKE